MHSSASSSEEDGSSAPRAAMDVPSTQGESLSLPVAGALCSTGRPATESGAASACVGHWESTDAPPGGLISLEESWDLDGKVRNNIDETQPRLQLREAPSRSSRGSRLQSIDLTTRSEFFLVDRQLVQYFKKASTMNWPLFLALLSSTFCHEKRLRIRIFCACSAFSLTLNVVPLFLAGWMAEKEPSTGEEEEDDEKVEPSDRNRILGLCVAAYLSNLSWTATAVSFAMLLGAGYSWFFLILAVLIFPYYFIVKHGIENGITWGVVQYAEHRSDMDFLFGLCFDITQTNMTALAATLFGYLQRSQCVDVAFRAPEIILFIAVVIGLFVMTMCTVPPAAGLPSHRDSFVRRIMKLAVYWLLILTSMGLFLTVLKICGPYALLSFIVVVVDAVAYWPEYLKSTFIVQTLKVVTRCVEQKGFWRDAERQAIATPKHARSSGQVSTEGSASRAGDKQQPPRAAREQSRLLVSFFSIVSGALMVSYSLNIGAQSWKYKASLLSMYSAFVAYLGMVVTVREAPKDKTIAVWVSSCLAALLLLGALVCVIAFILSNPLHLGAPLHEKQRPSREDISLP
ncbi:uncharacterized protein LOC133923800 isoform X2 [Phragmites australis]|uniref:uncharacterized protein LOC133923800 isoform X2 n=1 Tax=Phragmites australis TaxID=29695 RepID=UPI002D799719|nr:uncharacterized protein LOC133923800 isoform X2 [Phragmites australis]